MTFKGETVSAAAIKAIALRINALSVIKMDTTVFSRKSRHLQNTEDFAENQSSEFPGHLLEQERAGKDQILGAYCKEDLLISPFCARHF